MLAEKDATFNEKFRELSTLLVQAREQDIAASVSAISGFIQTCTQTGVDVATIFAYWATYWRIQAMAMDAIRVKTELGLPWDQQTDWVYCYVLTGHPCGPGRDANRLQAQMVSELAAIKVAHVSTAIQLHMATTLPLLAVFERQFGSDDAIDKDALVEFQTHMQQHPLLAEVIRKCYELVELTDITTLAYFLTLPEFKPHHACIKQLMERIETAKATLARVVEGNPDPALQRSGLLASKKELHQQQAMLRLGLFAANGDDVNSKVEQKIEQAMRVVDTAHAAIRGRSF